jgi:hypothetical protein
MKIDDAVKKARWKRDQYNIDVHVLKDDMNEYYTVLDFNFKIMITSQKDKKVYYTAWNLKI